MSRAGIVCQRNQQSVHRRRPALSPDRWQIPQRTLERGFARVEDETGEPILTTAQARVAGRFGVVFADGRVEAEVAAARRRRRRTRPRDPAEFGQTRLKGFDPDE